MIENEIKEGNKIVAEFMGWTKSPVHGWLPKGREDRWYYGGDDTILFNSSWDWLMPVIRQINSLGKEYQFAIFKNYVSCIVEKGGKFYKDFSFSHAEYITAEQDDITAAFKLVVKFVEWYNINVKVKQELNINE